MDNNRIHRQIIELKNKNIITFSWDCSFEIWKLNNNNNKYEDSKFNMKLSDKKKEVFYCDSYDVDISLDETFKNINNYFFFLIFTFINNFKLEKNYI